MELAQLEQYENVRETETHVSPGMLEYSLEILLSNCSFFLKPVEWNKIQTCMQKPAGPFHDDHSGLQIVLIENFGVHVWLFLVHF